MTKRTFDKIAAGLREAQDVAAIIAERDAAIRERDEARAALASARAEALEEAATAATRAAWKHEGDDDYSRGMDRGAREQVEACAAAIRALKEARR